jgi:hypothetical protein
VLLPNLPLGLLTTGVEALTGVLLPATSVFLVLLCNDRAVLGPWVNRTGHNIVVGVVVWVLLLLSFASGASTLFPELSATTLEIGLGAGAGIGTIAGALVGIVHRSARAPAPDPDTPAGLDPTLNRDLDQRSSALGRAERTTLRDQDRLAWRTPALATLTRPQLSPLRRAGLITLRAYLIIAATLIILKVIQVAFGLGGHPNSGPDSDALATAHAPVVVATSTR